MYDKPALLVPQSLHRRGDASASISAATCCAPLDEAALRATVRELAARGHRVARGLPAVLVPASGARGARARDRRARRCRAAASRSPPTSCRRSANITGSRTTVINAYLQPILARYIAQLDRRLTEAGVTTRQKYIMQSNGGMATFAAARAQGGDHRAVGPGRRRHRGRLCLPHDRLAATSSPSTWAAPPATWR